MSDGGWFVGRVGWGFTTPPPGPCGWASDWGSYPDLAQLPVHESSPGIVDPWEFGGNNINSTEWWAMDQQTEFPSLPALTIPVVHGDRLAAGPGLTESGIGRGMPDCAADLDRYVIRLSTGTGEQATIGFAWMNLGPSFSPPWEYAEQGSIQYLYSFGFGSAPISGNPRTLGLIYVASTRTITFFTNNGVIESGDMSTLVPPLPSPFNRPVAAFLKVGPGSTVGQFSLDVT